MSKTWHEKHKDGLSFGDRAADRMRSGMGSWGFIFGALAFLAVWIGLAESGVKVDNPQLTILNLILSCLAALQGGILLIAAKRQDAVASAMAQHDYDVNVASKAEIDELKTMQMELHGLISEVHRMLQEGD